MWWGLTQPSEVPHLQLGLEGLIVPRPKDIPPEEGEGEGDEDEQELWEELPDDEEDGDGAGDDAELEEWEGTSEDEYDDEYESGDEQH
ncbi:hypothetical protein M011DRAFT_471848 [Sporormia fimetaria CBS 119925]|uniref:Uncharacterized protein n=1 Tax=Sporormia fimetaria CBS 119925 TaxID=1340428 RepID=A0A6A6V0W9_9PLEO|nr:hypothetical protein M011DRAFT_471848 [Sporormia fimetaria CBS 119925]